MFWVKSRVREARSYTWNFCQTWAGRHQEGLLFWCTPIRDPPAWEALNQDLPAGMLRRPLLHVKKAQCKIHSFTEKLATFYTVTCTDQALLSSQLKLTVHPHCRAARPYLSLALNELGCVNAGVSSSEGCLLTAWGCSANTDFEVPPPISILNAPCSVTPGQSLGRTVSVRMKTEGSFYPRSE